VPDILFFINTVACNQPYKLIDLLAGLLLPNVNHRDSRKPTS